MSSVQPPPFPPRRPFLRLLKIIGACVLGLIALVAALWVEENWRGARAWAACQRELAAKGEQLDWHAHLPPPVPDEQNLALAPLFVREYHYQTDPATRTLTFGPMAERHGDFWEMPYGGPKPGDLRPGTWDVAKPTDLAGYARVYRERSGFPHADQPQAPAADVLLALTRYAPVLDELAQAAAERPRSHFPVLWEQEDPFLVALPQYILEQQIVTTLRLRASASLAVGREADALRDLELCWRLCGDMRQDPVLIAHLVEITCLNLTLTPIWEGLADRRWSRDELTRLQADLQRLDLLADYVATFRGERAFGLHGIDFMQNKRDLSRVLSLMQSPESDSRTSGVGRSTFAAIPRGWFDFNKAVLARHMQAYSIEAVDPEAHRVFVKKFAAGTRAYEIMPFSVGNMLARLRLPTFESVSHRTARYQTGLDEAVTACALERFFLDHQAYPLRLDELVPAYLERVLTDVIDGAPLHYQTTPDGRYQLHGIGWNARDDGGTVVWKHPRAISDTEGDWVWQYADLQPPPPAQ